MSTVRTGPAGPAVAMEHLVDWHGRAPAVAMLTGASTRAEAAALGDLRALVDQVLRRAGYPAALAADARLIVSELWTNSLRHSRTARLGGQIAVLLWRLRRGVRIEVHDAGADQVPVLRPHTDFPQLGHGAGLHLVSALSSAWGYCGCVPPGLRTWADLDQAAALDVA
ncbi:ATP-binding protein [Bailinhaonella thermotolerans]|uniref:ATP-binding protein n=1 Tax=Bailinhaonella thermotolerans TaxID=1070861 RepID=A0A3A4A028_9ACTN|nr:ATP-binding protein [Bailinhaonella thermotolerans]RJL21068.1 ATP-binding protein [Bailinhaonella thermotolerans]